MKYFVGLLLYLGIMFAQAMMGIDKLSAQIFASFVVLLWAVTWKDSE